MQTRAEDSSECINCNRPATDRYGVYFDSGRTIQDVLLCSECVEEFADVDFLAIEAEPMLIRGSEERSEE